MLAAKILNALDDVKRGPTFLLAIIDLRRGDRDVTDLWPVLKSNSLQLLSTGLWMLGELPLKIYESGGFVERLRELLDHDNALVRLHAFGAIFPALNWAETESFALLVKLRQDPNEGVRNSAEAAAATLSIQLGR
jgi:hypothetical protein